MAVTFGRIVHVVKCQQGISGSTAQFVLRQRSDLFVFKNPKAQISPKALYNLVFGPKKPVSLRIGNYVQVALASRLCEGVYATT